MSAPAFRCPQCNERLRVYGAPWHKDGEAIERTRRCPGCGYAVRTRETVIEDRGFVPVLRTALKRLVTGGNE